MNPNNTDPNNPTPASQPDLGSVLNPTPASANPLPIQNTSAYPPTTSTLPTPPIPDSTMPATSPSPVAPPPTPTWIPPSSEPPVIPISPTSPVEPVPQSPDTSSYIQNPAPSFDTPTQPINPNPVGVNSAPMDSWGTTNPTPVPDWTNTQPNSAPQDPNPLGIPTTVPTTPPSFEPLTPPVDQPTPIQPDSTTSLDNPLGVPTQPPPIDGMQSQPFQPQEQAPTDLSHLLADNTSDQGPIYTPPITQPETLVTPNSGQPVIPTITTQNEGSKFPKWAIGLMVGLVLIVAGASAYFILGIGQNKQTATVTSLPAAKQTITQPPAPSPSPKTTTQQTATSSGSFGELNGSQPSPSTASAADLLRQRQQAR